MDPLSITASVIAILQLSSKVVGYLTNVKDASKECNDCAVEVVNLHSLLLNLKFHLEGGNVSDSWYTAVRALTVENGPLDQFKQALELLHARMTNGGRLKMAQDMLVWKFKKEELTMILGRIERLKTLVLIALQRDHLKLSQSIKDDTQSIKDDTNNIKSNIDFVRTEASNADHRKLLEWISPTNYPAQQSDIISRRQEGTGQWFLASPQLTKWLSEPQGTLFCPGIPGAGKTVVAAIAIDHLLNSVASNSNGVAYIYCNYKTQEEQDTSRMLAAILKQLMQTQTAVVEPVERLHKRHIERGSRPSADEVFNVLRDVTANYSSVFIVIDALDECHDGTRRQFLAKLLDLQAGRDVRLMATSRFIPEIVEVFNDVSTLEVQASKEDVKQFVAGQLDRLPNCIRRDTVLQVIVQERVVEAVGGMFLLARLYVDSLLDKRTKSKVISTLGTLGGGFEALDKAYDQAIERIDGQLPGDSALAKRVLSWITNVKRPLTIAEICYALSIEQESKDLDPDNIPDIDDLVAVCAGLVSVDEKSKIIRLVHYTTQKYFERIQDVWSPSAQLDIASTCLTYLSFTCFGNCTSTLDRFYDDTDWLDQHPFLGYAAQHWGDHTRPIQTEIRELASSFLRHEDLVYCATQIMSGLEDPELIPLEGRTSLHVMAQFGLQALLAEFLSAARGSSTVSINARDSHDRNPLSLAAEFGHKNVVALLLENGADIEAKCDEFGTPLQTAAYHGHEPTLRLLLDSGAKINAEGNDYGTALQAASYQGHEHIVRVLLEQGAEINADGPEYGSALQSAAYNGHEEIVKLLLSRGADLHAQSGSRGNALQVAALNGYEQLVIFLLNEGADICSKVGICGDALQCASCGGHEGIVHLLLNAGADIHAQSGKKNNALQAASFRGQKEIVQLLLDNGSDVNARGGEYGTALQAASYMGATSIVRLLIDRGADVNAQGGEMGHALQAASSSWLYRSDNTIKEIIELLLDAGAEVNAQGGKDANALYAAVASYKGHDVVMKLLHKGADVNAQGGFYGNALQAALYLGREDIVKLLLDEGADINVQGGYYSNALQAALSEGYERIVKIMLDMGADIKAQDGSYNNAFCAAIITCSVPIVRLFLDRGVDVNVRDRHGWTAAMIAYQTGNREINNAFEAFARDQQTGWDQCLLPSILTTLENSTLKTVGNGTVVYSGKLSSQDMDSGIQMRADHPFPMTWRSIYFEVTIHNAGTNSWIGVGLCHEYSAQRGMPGWRKGSWAYHGDDGKLFLEEWQGIQFGDTYGAGDVIGCGWDIGKDELFFTKNGTRIGCAGKAPRGRLFAVVGLRCGQYEFSVNFGPDGFKYSS